MDAASTDAAGAGIVASVELPGDRHIVVREGCVDDADALTALYRRLSIGDLSMRFFTAAAPPPTFVERWLTIAERGGLVLVAIAVQPDGATTLVAEAGYSPLDGGDGELGITVDPAWRGWLGPWLLELLVREAGARGVPNIQSVMRLGNRRMISLLRRRGSAIVEQDPPDEIRLVIGTSGRRPSWPSDHGHPRVLVEATAGRWLGEDAAKRAGFEVRTCRGPGTEAGCPLLDDGHGCPLAEGADAVVMLLPPSDPRTARLTALHQRRPELQIIVPQFGSAGANVDETADEVVESIRRAVGLD